MVSSVQFSAYVPQPKAVRFGDEKPAGGSSFRWSNLNNFDKDISQKVFGDSPTLVTRILDAIARPFKMAFLRPKGWAEMSLHLIPGLHFLTIPLFTGKHALEGFLQVDSLFIPRTPSLTGRWFKGGISGRTEYGRTLLQALWGRPVRGYEGKKD